MYNEGCQRCKRKVYLLKITHKGSMIRVCKECKKVLRLGGEME